MARGHAYVTLCLDDVDEVRVGTAQLNDDGRPFVFVSVGQALSLWGHDPAKFRELGAALTAAAEQLHPATKEERDEQTQRAVGTRD